jgi:hypothetical protein
MIEVRIPHLDFHTRTGVIVRWMECLPWETFFPHGRGRHTAFRVSDNSFFKVSNIRQARRAVNEWPE